MAVDVRDVLGFYLERLLSSREYPKTICPSEVARALSIAELKASATSDWRELMPQVREILWAMRENGEVQILQKGELIPEATGLGDVQGPIRARRSPE